MNAIIVLVLCVTALGTVVCQQKSPLIVKVRDALPGDAPWMVSLSSFGSKGKHFCGGSILDSTHILTSANCVERMDPRAEQLKARVGSLDHNHGGVLYNVVKVTPHGYPVFNHSFVYFIHDLAILCTDKNMTLNSNLPVPISAVQLPDGQELSPDTTVRVAGWGLNTTTGTTLSDKLKVMDIPNVAQYVCASVTPEKSIVYNVNCTGTDGKGACIIDEGNPLSKDGVQYGISLRGLSLCSPEPLMFTSVNLYRDWIEEFKDVQCYEPVTNARIRASNDNYIILYAIVIILKMLSIYP